MGVGVVGFNVEVVVVIQSSSDPLLVVDVGLMELVGVVVDSIVDEEDELSTLLDDSVPLVDVELQSSSQGSLVVMLLLGHGSVVLIMVVGTQFSELAVALVVVEVVGVKEVNSDVTGPLLDVNVTVSLVTVLISVVRLLAVLV